jgi:predicted DNA-binding transcriptional regulator AlpA
MAEEFVGVNELERRFGLPVSWWYAKAEAEQMPSYKIGKYRKFRISEVSSWLEQHRCGPGEAGSAGR